MSTSGDLLRIGKARRFSGTAIKTNVERLIGVLLSSPAKRRAYVDTIIEEASDYLAHRAVKTREAGAVLKKEKAKSKKKAKK